MFYVEINRSWLSLDLKHWVGLLSNAAWSQPEDKTATHTGNYKLFLAIDHHLIRIRRVMVFHGILHGVAWLPSNSLYSVFGKKISSPAFHFIFLWSSDMNQSLQEIRWLMICTTPGSFLVVLILQCDSLSWRDFGVQKRLSMTRNFMFPLPTHFCLCPEGDANFCGQEETAEIVIPNICWPDPEFGLRLWTKQIN